MILIPVMYSIYNIVLYIKRMVNDRWKKYLRTVYGLATKKPIKYDKSFIKRLYNDIGRPADGLEIVHVTGTNGKGSFCHKTELAMRMSGIRAGLFTSPHINTIRERIQVGGDLVDPDYCVDLFEYFDRKGERIGETMSFFDFQVLLALKYFKDKQVDAAVIEVGIGGLNDSTNVIPSPLAAVITSIDLDHTEILGNTKQEVLCKIE